MSYVYGKTRPAMSSAARIQLANLEAAKARQERMIHDLNARLWRRKMRGDVNMGRPYLETLTAEERAQKPELWPGDTPQACARRLYAAAADAMRLERRNRQAGRERATQTLRDRAEAA